MDQTGLGGRYPGPAVQILDPRFERYRLPLAGVERIATGCRWGEGPVWFGDGRYLLWSDIPNNRILRWDEETGAVERVPQAVEQRQRQHARPAGPARHLRARHAARHAHRVRRHDHGARRPLRGQARSTRPTMSSCKSDGSIWFTDPPFGILGNYEGSARRAGTADERLPGRRPTGEADGRGRRHRPGRTGSASRRTRRGSTSSSAGADAARLIRAYDVADGGTRLEQRARGRSTRARARPTASACDVDGNLWCGWGMGERGARRRDGVRARRASRSAASHLPERCANVCFGGAQRNRLFMAASQSLYALYVNTQGAAGG